MISVPLTKKRLDAIIEALTFRSAGEGTDSDIQSEDYKSALRWALNRQQRQRGKQPPYDPLLTFQTHAVPHESGCILWNGHIDMRGYGRFRWEKQAIGAHRGAWLIAHGSIADGAQVLHKCDVKRCVNVEHLFLGTHADNMWDKASKGRGGRKLTLDQVNEMRTLWAGGNHTQVELGRMFGIRPQEIWKIVHRQTWRAV